MSGDDSSSLKSKVGLKTGPYEAEVTSEHLRTFCRAVGAPGVEDSDGAEAPPTYFTVFRKGEFELLEQIGIQLSQVLHAEQEYTYQGGVRSGERLVFETELVQVLEKKSSKGGAMYFLGFETRFSSRKHEPGKELGKSRSLIVYRSPAP